MFDNSTDAVRESVEFLAIFSTMYNIISVFQFACKYHVIQSVTLYGMYRLSIGVLLHILTTLVPFDEQAFF